MWACGRLLSFAFSLSRADVERDIARDDGVRQRARTDERHPGLTVDRAALDRPGIDPAWITEEGGLRLRPDYWPDLGGMDGFYMAVLRKG